MWHRFLRLLTTGLNMHAFYANPVALVKSLLLIIILPYMVYIFWGSLIIIGLIAFSISLVYYYFNKRKKDSYSS